MVKRINYSCSKCGWATSIIVEWADLKPRSCGNKKCLTSFIKNPSMLLIEMPKVEIPVETLKPSKSKKMKEEDNV